MLAAVHHRARRGPTEAINMACGTKKCATTKKAVAKKPAKKTTKK
ncbi:MAG TPA: hypothetical protein VD837_00945 [Terriglobales bacterium]|nr:hypothetical protein [Terriglobales bacterium]